MSHTAWTSEAPGHPKILFLQCGPWCILTRETNWSVLLRKAISTIVPYGVLYIYKCKFNDSSEIDAKRCQAFTLLSALCGSLNGKQLAAQTPWPTRIISPRHEILAGLKPIARCALNCQDQWRWDEILNSNPQLTYILSIFSASLTGINGAVMLSEKPC